MRTSNDHVVVTYGRDKCPDSEDGGHTLVNQGRSLAHFADLFRCTCGKQRIGNTDEARERTQ